MGKCVCYRKLRSYNDVFPEVDWWKELVKNVGYEQVIILITRWYEENEFISYPWVICMTEIFLYYQTRGFRSFLLYRRYNWRSNFDFNITSTTKLSFNVAGKMGYQNQPSYYENVDSPDERFF